MPHARPPIGPRLLERFERVELVDQGEALRHEPALVVRRLERLRAVPS